MAFLAAKFIFSEFGIKEFQSNVIHIDLNTSYLASNI